MNAKDLTTIDQLSAFLEGTQRVRANSFYF